MYFIPNISIPDVGLRECLVSHLYLAIFLGNIGPRFDVVVDTIAQVTRCGGAKRVGRVKAWVRSRSGAPEPRHTLPNAVAHCCSRAARARVNAPTHPCLTRPWPRARHSRQWRLQSGAALCVAPAARMGYLESRCHVRSTDPQLWYVMYAPESKRVAHDRNIAGR